jgi:pilus assembly protein CpaC
MQLITCLRGGPGRPTLASPLGLALLLLCLWPTGRAAAQSSPCGETISGFKLCPPPPPERPPRPPQGPGSVAAFVDSLSSTDSAFEIVVGQGRILTTKENLAVAGKPAPLIAVGDPSVVEVEPVNQRQLRLTGMKIGVTDLSITTADNRTYSFEIRVVADLHVLRGQLQCVFPDATLKLAQIRDHLVVEGQARDSAQVARILETIRAYLVSVQASQLRKISGQQARAPQEGMPRPGVEPRPEEAGKEPPAEGPLPGPGGALTVQGTVPVPQIINLIRVPGTQQVLLKVRVAELNRTALRQIGGDFLAVDHDTGAIVGSQIGGANVTANALVTGRMLTGTAQTSASALTTVFGIFEEGGFSIFLSALRRNALLKILAEPNLVALNGHKATFLAGGEFPVPVPQTGGGGIAPTITVQFKEFGVRLSFVPYILDGDVIRLSVDPEVSSIDFTIGTTLVPGGSPVPGLNVRNAHTTVEMREGQTLAIAGLLQLSLDGQTSRIPGLGDLPILGPFFSNTTSNRIEKELIVLVTPYLIEPLNHGQVPPSPGDEVNAPNDLEFYLLNRIEGRTGRDHRATVEYDDALRVLRCLMRLEDRHVQGPHGFCD